MKRSDELHTPDANDAELAELEQELSALFQKTRVDPEPAQLQRLDHFAARVPERAQERSLLGRIRAFFSHHALQLMPLAGVALALLVVLPRLAPQSLPVLTDDAVGTPVAMVTPGFASGDAAKVAELVGSGADSIGSWSEDEDDDEEFVNPVARKSAKQVYEGVSADVLAAIEDSL